MFCDLIRILQTLVTFTALSTRTHTKSWKEQYSVQSTISHITVVFDHVYIYTTSQKFLDSKIFKGFLKKSVMPTTLHLFDPNTAKAVIL